MSAQKIETLEKKKSCLDVQLPKPTKRISQINMQIAALNYSEDLQALIALRFHTQELVYQAVCAKANFSHAALCKHFSETEPLNHTDLSFEQLQRKYDAVQMIL
jgi:hypothetical protein